MDYREYNKAIVERAYHSKYKPARRCDEQAVVWLAQMNESGQLNFHAVYLEARKYHTIHPRAAIRRDRLWTMSAKNHDLWAVTQRLLLSYNWALADCINPRRSAADDDMENIYKFAEELFPAKMVFLSIDWRELKQKRKEYLRSSNGNS